MDAIDEARDDRESGDCAAVKDRDKQLDIPMTIAREAYNRTEGLQAIARACQFELVYGHAGNREMA